MEINGVPLHPLVVHAAVVFVPLAAVLGAVYALVPKWRYLLRHPTLAVTAAAAISTQLAGMTGENLAESTTDSTLLDNHEMWAGRLTFGVWVLAAVVAVAWWVLPAVTGLIGRSDKAARIPALVLPATILLPILAVAVLVLVYFTGDAGAQAVWTG
jgi:uncharacterized membrane protein